MPRGDRLLLALEVLDAWFLKDRFGDGRWYCEPFAARCIANVLTRFGFDLERDVTSIREWEFARTFLQSGNGIERAEFVADLILDLFDETHTISGARDRHYRFFAAIASGELTEADFQ